MAFFNLNLNITNNNLELLQCMLKFTVLFTVFHLILCLSKTSFKNLSLISKFGNDMFLNILIAGLISIMFYHLIFKNLISINN